MHIAFVSAYPPGKASLNEYGYHFAKALKEKPEVNQLSIIADSLPTPVAEEDSIYRVWQFNDPMNAWHICRKLDQLEPDAVIFNLQFAVFGDKRIPAALGLLAPWISQRRRPTITLLHNIFETVDLESAGFGSSRFMNHLTRFAGKAMTHVLLGSGRLAVTMPTYAEILRRDYRAKNVFHAPHGTFEVPEPIHPLPEDPTVMAFGKFGTYKKVEILLEAHEQLLKRNPKIRLVIAGSDSPNAKGYLEDVQKRYQLANVTYTGYVAEEDVPRIFRDSTVVAFPYESTTGSSGVLHQAGQFGRAAVMPRIGDLADLVTEEGYRAKFFQAGDVEGLTEGLWELLSNPEESKRLGEANHQAASQLTLSEVVYQYLEQIEIMKQRRSHRHVQRDMKPL